MKHHKSGLFLMEVIIGILFLALASALCLQIFVKAKMMNDESVHLSQASQIVSNIIEVSKNKGLDEGHFYFDENGNKCLKKQAQYLVTIKENDELYTINVSYDHDTIYQLDYYHHQQKEVLS